MFDWAAIVVCSLLCGIYMELRSLRSAFEEASKAMRSGNFLTQEILKHTENTNFHISQTHSLVNMIDSTLSKALNQEPKKLHDVE